MTTMDESTNVEVQVKGGNPVNLDQAMLSKDGLNVRQQEEVGQEQSRDNDTLIILSTPSTSSNAEVTNQGVNGKPKILEPSINSLDMMKAATDGSLDGAGAADEDATMTFPQRLMEILNNEEHADIISWLPNGRGFMIYKKKQFETDVMPKYFNKQSKYTSFTRKLNRWGFVRVTRGPEMGAYYHKFFKRGDSKLCMQMSCQRPHGTAATTISSVQSHHHNHHSGDVGIHHDSVSSIMYPSPHHLGMHPNRSMPIMGGGPNYHQIQQQQHMHYSMMHHQHEPQMPHHYYPPHNEGSSMYPHYLDHQQHHYHFSGAVPPPTGGQHHHFQTSHYPPPPIMDHHHRMSGESCSMVPPSHVITSGPPRRPSAEGGDSIIKHHDRMAAPESTYRNHIPQETPIRQTEEHLSYPGPYPHQDRRTGTNQSQAKK